MTEGNFLVGLGILTIIFDCNGYVCIFAVEIKRLCAWRIIVTILASVSHSRDGMNRLVRYLDSEPVVASLDISA